MTKWSEAKEVQEVEAWIEKERVRLGKLASRKGAIAGKKLDELKMKQNVSRIDDGAGVLHARAE